MGLYQAPMFRYVIALLLLPAPSLAEPDRVSLLFGSYHVNATEEFREVNPGLFLDWTQPSGMTLGLGVYRNSYGRISVAGLAGVDIWESGETTLGLFGGLAHYPVDGPKSPLAIGDVVPIGGLRLQHRNLVAIAIPGDGVATDLVLGFGMTWQLD